MSVQSDCLYLTVSAYSYVSVYDCLFPPVSYCLCLTDLPGVSVKVGELRPRAESRDKADNAAVPCVFAPDDSRVAWTCGDRKVLILPWNKHRNCL